jgi:hypothetical protein
MARPVREMHARARHVRVRHLRVIYTSIDNIITCRDTTSKGKASHDNAYHTSVVVNTPVLWF